MLSLEGGRIVSGGSLLIIGCLALGTLAGELLKIEDPEPQGAAFGTAAHVIGTSKVSEVGQLQAAVGTLSLTVSGVLTAILFPIVVNWL